MLVNLYCARYHEAARPHLEDWAWAGEVLDKAEQNSVRHNNFEEGKGGCRLTHLNKEGIK